MCHALPNNRQYEPWCQAGRLGGKACLTCCATEQAFGPQGGLPIETQENTGFIKKVAEKLHMRSRESDRHAQHRRTEARARGAPPPPRRGAVGISCLTRFAPSPVHNTVH